MLPKKTDVIINQNSHLRLTLAKETRRILCRAKTRKPKNAKWLAATLMSISERLSNELPVIERPSIRGTFARSKVMPDSPNEIQEIDSLLFISIFRLDFCCLLNFYTPDVSEGIPAWVMYALMAKTRGLASLVTDMFRA